jgi:lipid-binding SYLF domain-containing protein
MPTLPVTARLAFLLVFLSASVLAQSDNVPEIIQRADAAAEVLEEIMSVPDRGIPQEVLESAACIAIAPSMFKAGVDSAGRHGKGVASCRVNGQWSPPGPFIMTGGSWELQWGERAVDLVMLVMNEHGMRKLLSNQLEIGAGASASTGPVGRHVAAGTEWKMRSQTLTYSRSRGVFAGVTLNGVEITQDHDGTRILYGRTVPFATILGGKVRTPEGVQRLMSTLTRHAPDVRPKKARSLYTYAEWRDE